MKITKKTLNNKTRKGDYWYVKEPGVRGAYYKGTLSESEAKKQYAHRHVTPKKASQQQQAAHEKALRAPTKKDFSRKGLYEKTYVADAITPGVEEGFYDQLQGILGTERTKKEDFKKHREKHVYDVTIHGDTGVLAHFQDIGTKNFSEFTNTYLRNKTLLVSGGAVTYHWNVAVASVGGISSLAVDRVNTGTIRRVTVRVTYDNRL